MRHRRYPIPETRLPFINGQIAEIEFRGRPHLMSAAWCGPGGVRFCIWDPLTGESHIRHLREVPGCYVILPCPDGRIYLGCGNGDLYCYDPAADVFEPLVTDVLHSITWGGCVTDRHIIWASAPGAGVYDWRNRKLVNVFDPLDSEQPMAIYGHNVLPCPDGKAVAFLSVPRACVIEIDPTDLTAKSHSPEQLADARWVTQAVFLDDRTIGAVIDADKPFTLLLDYPSLAVCKVLPTPGPANFATQRGVMLDNQWHAFFGAKGSVYRFDTAAEQWQLVIENWMGDGIAILGTFGQHHLVALSVDGHVRYFDVRTGQTREHQLEVWGALEAHAMCVVPELDLVIGAPFINSRFWTIDLKTGMGKDRGRAQPGGGQINQIVWDDVRKKALLSAYTWAALTEYDPAKEGEWPNNPRLIAYAKDEGLLRPRALVFDGRYAWMGTSALYGTLGGGLVRFDPQSNTREVWRHIVRDQIVNSLVLDLDQRRLYGGSEIYADCESCPPTRTSGELFSCDLDTLQVVARAIPRKGAPAANVLCLLPNGVLAHDGSSLYRWEPERQTLTVLGAAPPGLKQVVPDDNGTLWALAQGGIGQLNLADPGPRLTLKIPESRKIARMQIVNDTMYYPAGSEVHCVNLKSLLDSVTGAAEKSS